MTYAGDIEPTACWQALKESSSAFLVDVRTQAEWTFVGVVALEPTMTKPIGQQWQAYPDMAVDPAFVDHLVDVLNEQGGDTESELYFLCRSGVRSLAAARAMSAAGYTKSFNISGGFEGAPDDLSHRGQVNGWKAQGLAWQQG